MDLGKIQERMVIYSDVTGTEIGAIDLHENGLKLGIEARRITVPMEYLQSIASERDLALGKSLVRMVVYDIMGLKNEFRFIMSGVHLAVLRKRCGK